MEQCLVVGELRAVAAVRLQQIDEDARLRLGGQHDLVDRPEVPRCGLPPEAAHAGGGGLVGIPQHPADRVAQDDRRVERFILYRVVASGQRPRCGAWWHSGLDRAPA